MARASKQTTKDDLDKLTEELTCPVCSKLFRDPKILPCLHCCCRECLEGVIAKRSSETPFTCPECHAVAEIPHNDVTKFSTAFFVNRLKAVHTVMEKEQEGDDIACEVCQFQTSSAQSYCRNCGQFMCATCEKTHKKDKPSSSHKLIKTKKLQQNLTQNIKPDVGKCVTHDKPLKSYCSKCDQLICQTCTGMEHKNHKQENIEKAATAAREGINHNLSELRQGQSLVEEAGIEVNRARDVIMREANDTKAFVNKCFGDLLHKLQECQEELLWSVDQIHDEKLSEASAQEKGLRQLDSKMQRVTRFVERCLDNCNNEEIIEIQKQLSRKMATDCQKCQEAQQQGVPSIDPDTFADIKSKCVTKVAEIASVCTVADPQSCSVEGSGTQSAETGRETKFLVHTKQSNGAPCTATQVVQAELKSLATCTSRPLNVKQLENGVYEASYAPTSRGQHLIAVLVNGKPLTPNVFSVLVRPPLTPNTAPIHVIKGVDKLLDIAITQDGRLLATQHKKGCVISFDQEGKKMNTVLSGLDQPSGIAIDNSSNVYVTESRTSSLKKFDMSFTAVGQTEEKGNTPGALDNPKQIALNQNKVFVCDWNNSRIQVFNENLEYQQLHNVEKPVSIAFNNNNEMFVVDGSKSCLFKMNSDKTELTQVCQGLDRPCGVHVDNTYIYVTERGSKQVSVLHHNGTVISSFGKGVLKEPGAITGDEEGYLYVCDEASEAVFVF